MRFFKKGQAFVNTTEDKYQTLAVTKTDLNVSIIPINIQFRVRQMTMLKPTMKHPLTETNNLKDVRKMRQRKIENE